jgi:hypothetical protein
LYCKSRSFSQESNEARWKHNYVFHFVCNNCNCIGLQMDLKCEVVFNINIVHFLLRHVAIKFSENYVEYGWKLRKE